MDRMAALSKEQLTAFLRGISLRQVRLASGLILFAYLVSHFLNHALGNISLEALASGVYLHMAFWQFLPITILFYAACLVHTALGIWALYERRQFRWKAIEPLQLALGLSVPMLIIVGNIGRVGLQLAMIGDWAWPSRLIGMTGILELIMFVEETFDIKVADDLLSGEDDLSSETDKGREMEDQQAQDLNVEDLGQVKGVPAIE
jgi:succinate dehydrogenase hydrophobic anchor subunit